MLLVAVLALGGGACRAAGSSPSEGDRGAAVGAAAGAREGRDGTGDVSSDVGVDPQTGPPSTTLPPTTEPPTTVTTAPLSPAQQASLALLAVPPPPLPLPLAPPHPDGTPVYDQNRVFVVGDSVVVGIRDVLPGYLPGWSVTVDAAVSRFERDVPVVISARRGEIGRVAVVLMGHNSSGGLDHGPWIRQVMEALSGVDRVVVLTAGEWGPGPADYNRDLRRLAAEYPSLVVAEWDLWRRALPDATADGIHLTPVGARTMSELIAAYVGPPPAPADAPEGGPAPPPPPVTPAAPEGPLGSPPPG